MKTNKWVFNSFDWWERFWNVFGFESLVRLMMPAPFNIVFINPRNFLVSLNWKRNVCAHGICETDEAKRKILRVVDKTLQRRGNQVSVSAMVEAIRQAYSRTLNLFQEVCWKFSSNNNWLKKLWFWLQHSIQQLKTILIVEILFEMTDQRNRVNLSSTSLWQALDLSYVSGLKFFKLERLQVKSPHQLQLVAVT